MTSIEALWTVAFGTGETPNEMVSAGVLVLETGRVLGGDSAYAYVGSFQVDRGDVSGTLRIIRHNPDPAFVDIWEAGGSEVAATFSGTMKGSSIIDGMLHHASGAYASFRMTRLEELP